MRLSVSSRSAWSPKRIPGLSGLHKEKPCLENKINQTNKSEKREKKRKKIKINLNNALFSPVCTN